MPADRADHVSDRAIIASAGVSNASMFTDIAAARASIPPNRASIASARAVQPAKNGFVEPEPPDIAADQTDITTVHAIIAAERASN